MTRTLLVSILLLFGAASVFAQQALFGTILDEVGDPVIGGSVSVYNGDAFLTGTSTDFDGNYRISLDPGEYELEFSYVGYDAQRLRGVRILAGQETKVDYKFEDVGVLLGEVVVVDYKAPVMGVDETSQGMTLTSKDVKKLGTRSINAIATLSAGATSADEGDAVSIRGGRDNGTQYITDGIRVTGSLVPESDIDQIQIVTGGVEAKYGDLSSGIISITTKGPSSKFNGFVEAETSRFLDDYNNNLVGASFSGPLIQREMEDGKNKQTILGYRFSGRYTYNEDDDAPATEIYQITDATLEKLEANPMRRLEGGGFAQEASFLTSDDIQVLDAQPFEEFERIDLTGKLDARLSDAIDVTLSGNFTDRSDRFTPGENGQTGDNWRLLNAHNNPYNDNKTYRGNFRFRHRLGNQASVLDTNNTSLISNALYTMQVGFQRTEQILQDTRHEDRFFDYGYIGRFENDNVETFNDEIGFVDGELTFTSTHDGYRNTFQSFTPGTQNPVLANYNLLGGEGFPSNDEDIIARNGVLANIIDDGVYTLHSSIGSIYNRFEKEKNDLITFNLQTQFDLKPGNGKSGVHNVQLGVLYEQRINRRYVLLPEELWQRGGQLANVALQDIDTNNVLRTVVRDTNISGIMLRDTVDIYGYRVEESSLEGDSRFYTQLRNKLGVGIDQFVDFGSVTPDQLNIGMFSAAEATSNNTLSYYGFDYEGNEIGTGVAWDDFFTTTNSDNQRTFPVAPIQPIYAAGYIQDKFTYKDIILRAGFRVDYFDANTKVLKDPYELYDIQTAGNFQYNPGRTRPSNIPDDAKVYLESAESQEVKAYRVDDTWFTAAGRQVNRAAEIFESDQVAAYTNENAVGNPNYIREIGYDPDASFEDYEAQINVMPRLSFSFPISEDANFFAHYDVLVQRPPSNTVATALDYYYFVNNAASSVFNNPNLKPTRTVDYEAGFQQRITDGSAVKLSFFVREMRDMIQRRTYLFAMAGLRRYTTYDNQDFGTVKGLNVSYDLRRTGPVSLRVSYGLQFADGTGSNSDSQRGSVQRGNLRTLYPLSYDERHRVAGALDFRYGSDEGPVLFGKPILEQLGINLSGSAVSGRPYTRLQTPTQLDGRVNEGDINGARLPWNLVTNLRIDRDLALFNDNGNGVDLNVYLRISNLLDRRNIISVYPATGLPDNDGFLTSVQGSASIANQINQDAYVQSYQWRVLNPNFFSLPRRIFVGASFSF